MNEIITSIRHRLPSARKLWLNIHLYLGLTAGFVLALIGLTGSLLTLSGPLQRIEIGDIFSFEGPPPRHANVDDWIANAYRTYGNLKTVSSIIGSGFGLAGGNAAMLSAEDADGKRWVVTINPVSGLPLGRYDILQATYGSMILSFHARLAPFGRWDSWGRDALAWLGVAMIVLMATGLYLWWPRNRSWNTALTLKRGARGRRRLLDLHNLFVVYLYVPLLIVALTGVYLARPDGSIAVSLVSTARSLDIGASGPRPGSCAARTTPGQAVAVALARFPSSKFVSIITPPDPEVPFQVQLAPPNELGMKGQTQVSVDRACPTILTSIDGEVASLPRSSEPSRIPYTAASCWGASVKGSYF